MRRGPVVMVVVLMVGSLVSCSTADEPGSGAGETSGISADGDEDATATSATAATHGDRSTTPTTGLPPTSTVTVTVTDVRGAVGYDLAGVLSRGGQPQVDDAIGGFGVLVDTDPFSTTQIVRAPQPDLEAEPFRPEAAWPYVTDEPLTLEPGTYTLQLWLGAWPLCCFSFPWLPADSPTLTGCRAVFTVGTDEEVDLTVRIPPRGEGGPMDECGPDSSVATSSPTETHSVPATSDRYVDPVFSTVELSTVTFADDLPDLVDGGAVSLQLDLFEPAGDVAERRPVIVWIHGGGFTGGSRRSLTVIATEYARLGYVTVAVDYRVDPDNRCGAVRDGTITDPVVLDRETDRCTRALQAAQDDVALAIAWLRSNATDVRIDSTRIAVGGFSAGAVTAINLAQRQNLAGPAPAESSVSVALAASGCNFDPESIDAADAPISILAAGGDRAVPYRCSVETLDLAEAAGVDVQRLLYPDEDGHAGGLYERHRAEVDSAWRDFLLTHLGL